MLDLVRYFENMMFVAVIERKMEKICISSIKGFGSDNDKLQKIEFNKMTINVNKCKLRVDKLKLMLILQKGKGKK